MSLKFSVDVSGMDEVKRQLAMACGRAESVLAQQVMKDTIPFVPALTGSLTQRTRVVGNEVIYPGPYARFLYYGKVMVDPATGSTYAPKGGHKVVTDRNHDNANPEKRPLELDSNPLLCRRTSLCSSNDNRRHHV